MSNALLNAALAYTARGWHVFPLAPGKKKPAISKEEGGRGFYDAVTDEATIRAWWQRWPQANIGIRTGRKSGLVVIDVHPRHGGDVSRLDLPPTLMARTPGGGWHLYYRHPGGWVPCDNKGKLGPGIDVRADGGYVVAPPSILAGAQWAYLWREGDHASDR